MRRYGSPGSHRWTDVSAVVAQVLGNEEVAERVCLSTSSVETHTKSAYRNTGVDVVRCGPVWTVDHGLFCNGKLPPGQLSSSARAWTARSGRLMVARTLRAAWSCPEVPAES